MEKHSFLREYMMLKDKRAIVTGGGRGNKTCSPPDMPRHTIML